MRTGLVLILLVVILLPLLEAGPKNNKAKSKTVAKKTKNNQKDSCFDIATNCNRILNYCSTVFYKSITDRFCRASCGVCRKGRKPAASKKPSKQKKNQKKPNAKDSAAEKKAKAAKNKKKN